MSTDGGGADAFGLHLYEFRVTLGGMEPTTTTTETTTTTVRALLEEALLDAPGVESVSTFREAGVLTRNEGLVLRMEDGTEFQVTVVQSR